MEDHCFQTPVDEQRVRSVEVGDVIYITGSIVTARDQAHRRLLEYSDKGIELPINLDGTVLYHCGPLVNKEKDKWVVVSAGPTTSTRMNFLTPKLLQRFGVRVIIGKGGMDHETVEALKRYGCIYCHFTGGAAVLAAKGIVDVERVEWLDLGIPEALWMLKVDSFGPLVVTIDSRGRSLYNEVKRAVQVDLDKLLKKIG
ncbi:MAG: FumA C-terminus/TtdB family hydratase beta subunit [Candidatus Bathyarchaeota archaeon]